MELQYSVILFYVLGLLLLYLVGWLLLVPFRTMLKYLLNAILGGVALWAINLFAPMTGIHVGVNPVSALVAGLLGVPGVILIIVLGWILG